MKTRDNSEKKILVVADWKGLEYPTTLGILTSQRTRGKEIFFFEYDPEWLKSDFALLLDPDLQYFEGPHYLPEGKENFGLFLDSSPDRWGKLLMRRREAALAKQEGREERTLLESDYLLGVFDGTRMGGLRFKLDARSDYLNNNQKMATPPWVSLRELEQASLNLESEDAIHDPRYLEWLYCLYPGSSLGGARPKSSVVDENNNLWIAKFPSANDEKDSGAWEMVLHTLAAACGIVVPEATLERFSGNHRTFLSKRFDRAPHSRIHFASAMTLLDHNDGDNHKNGVSYLELAAFITRHSASHKEDLEQLWRRMVFNILVSNTDDHLRNHGFLLTPTGWRLSPAFDMNPNEHGNGLTLNITENDNALDADLAFEVAKYFKLDEKQAHTIYLEISTVIKTWKDVAKKNSISQGEIELMSKAFRIDKTA